MVSIFNTQPILSHFSSQRNYIQEFSPSIQAGAQGYLLKDIRPEDLVQAVRDAYRGKTQLHPEIAKKLMAMVAGQSTTREKPGTTPGN